MVIIKFVGLMHSVVLMYIMSVGGLVPTFMTILDIGLAEELELFVVLSRVSEKGSNRGDVRGF